MHFLSDKSLPNGTTMKYENSLTAKPSFIIGDYNDSDSDNENKQMASVETQTEAFNAEGDTPTPRVDKSQFVWPAVPRSLDECLAIMKSDVRNTSIIMF